MSTTARRPSPRTVAAVALLALVPVSLFALDHRTGTWVAFVNVLLIFGSLLAITGPADGGHGSSGRASRSSP